MKALITRLDSCSLLYTLPLEFFTAESLLRNGGEIFTLKYFCIAC